MYNIIEYCYLFLFHAMKKESTVASIHLTIQGHGEDQPSKFTLQHTLNDPFEMDLASVVQDYMRLHIEHGTVPILLLCVYFWDLPHLEMSM